MTLAICNEVAFALTSPGGGWFIQMAWVAVGAASIASRSQMLNQSPQSGAAKAEEYARAQRAGPRVCLLVLGVHRSGTSAVTRVLSILGAALPRTLLGAGPSNESGHWESEKLGSELGTSTPRVQFAFRASAILWAMAPFDLFTPQIAHDGLGSLWSSRLEAANEPMILIKSLKYG
jgi:hypothetical protein